MSKTELLDPIAKYYIIESQLGYKQNVSLEQNRIQKLEKLFSRAETRALACLGSRRRLLGPSFQPVSAAGRLPGALCACWGDFWGDFWAWSRQTSSPAPRAPAGAVPFAAATSLLGGPGLSCLLPSVRLQGLVSFLLLQRWDDFCARQGPCFSVSYQYRQPASAAGAWQAAGTARVAPGGSDCSTGLPLEGTGMGMGTGTGKAPLVKSFR